MEYSPGILPISLKGSGNIFRYSILCRVVWSCKMEQWLLNGLAKGILSDCCLVKGGQLYSNLSKGKLLCSWTCFLIVEYVL